MVTIIIQDGHRRRIDLMILHKTPVGCSVIALKWLSQSIQLYRCIRAPSHRRCDKMVRDYEKQQVNPTTGEIYLTLCYLAER